MYRIRFRESAAAEFKLARDYSIQDRVIAWIKDLASAECEKNATNSADLERLLKAIEDIESIQVDIENGDWRKSLFKFRKSPLLEQVKAILIAVHRREPPYRLKAAVIWMSGIVGTLDAEIHVVYEVDHVKKEIVVVKFTGLPGQ